MSPRTRNRSLFVGGVVIVALVGARLALPSVVKAIVNHELADMGAYAGRVDDIDIALVRGAYVIRALEIHAVDGEARVPFVEVDTLDLSVQWRELLNGSLVGEVVATHPRVNFANGATDAGDQTGAGVDWREELQGLFPLQVNRLEIVDGEVHFADFSQEPPLDLDIRAVQGEARNLTNSEALAGSLVATIDVTGKPLGLGQLILHATLDPYTERPTFDVEMQVLDIPLTSLNPFLRAYAGVDAEGGAVVLYSEVASSGGELTGYVKPILTDARLFSLKKEVDEDHDNLAQVAWEAAVGGAKALLANPNTGAIAAKVPLRGELDAPAPDGWSGVVSLVGNAWIEALTRAFDDDVSLEDVPVAAPAEEAPKRADRPARRAQGPSSAEAPDTREDRREARRERKKANQSED